MIVATCEVYIRIDCVYSLKEKRSHIKRLIEKSKNKFNISIAEIGKNDSHKDIIIGFATITNSRQHADSIVQNVINYIESHSVGEIVDTIIEIW